MSDQPEQVDITDVTFKVAVVCDGCGHKQDRDVPVGRLTNARRVLAQIDWWCPTCDAPLDITSGRPWPSSRSTARLVKTGRRTIRGRPRPPM